MAITISRYAIFNGYNLNSVPGLSVYSITPPGSGNRTLNLFALARRSARKLSSAFYQDNTISLGVYISANTRELLEASMDTLLANIQGTEGSLIVPRSGGIARNYICTFQAPYTINNNMTNTDSPVGNTADLTLSFKCSDSFGYDQFLTPMLTLSGLTSTPNFWNYTQGGSVETQAPNIQIYYTGGLLGSGTVNVGNQNNGQTISVTRIWSIGETLVVDSQNKTVQVNGIDVPFSGAFPEFGLGLQQIGYSDTFTSRTYSLYAFVYNRWY